MERQATWTKKGFEFHVKHFEFYLRQLRATDFFSEQERDKTNKQTKPPQNIYIYVCIYSHTHTHTHTHIYGMDSLHRNMWMRLIGKHVD